MHDDVEAVGDIWSLPTADTDSQMGQHEADILHSKGWTVEVLPSQAVPPRWCTFSGKRVYVLMLRAEKDWQMLEGMLVLSLQEDVAGLRSGQDYRALGGMVANCSRT